MAKLKRFNNVYGVAIFLIALNLKVEPLKSQIVTVSQLPERDIPTVPQPTQVPSPLPFRREPLLTPSSPKPPTPEILNQEYYPTRARVKKIIFEGNTVFSDRQLETLLAPYTRREITFAELLQARAEVTKLYVDRGYISSGALVPLIGNQSIRPNEGVVVTIQIVEGKLEAINIGGSDRLQNYVRSRLKVATSPVLNNERLEEALRLLQSDPLIETISAQLNAGSRVGETLLEVQVKERQPFRVNTALDNERSPAVGTFQRSVELSHTNLLGFGDGLGLSYRNTEGSNGIQTSYSLPVNPQNGTVQFSYADISSNIVERPFSQLDIISDARSYELTFRQPLLRKASAEATKEFALGLTATRAESETSLLDTPFPLSAGADDQGRTRISAVRFFQEWNQRSNKEVLFVRSQFSLGINAFNATVNENAPDSRFFAWRGQTAWLRRLGDTTLVLRADLQLADRALVPLEQISFGGVTTVRGYRQDALLSDNGILASAELRIPVFSGQSGGLQVIPFVDIGTAWNSSDDESTLDPGTLASVGLGLQYQLGERFTARLDWGIPLIPLDNSSSNSWQENGLHFSLRYQPF